MTTEARYQSIARACALMWVDKRYAEIAHLIAGAASADAISGIAPEFLELRTELPALVENALVTTSPTRIENVTDAKEVKPLSIVTVPAFFVDEPFDEQKVISSIQAFRVCIDRLFHNAVRQGATHFTDDDPAKVINKLAGYARLNDTKLDKMFVGDEFPASIAGVTEPLALSTFGFMKDTSPELKILNPQEVLASNAGTHGWLYTTSVRVENSPGRDNSEPPVRIIPEHTRESWGVIKAHVQMPMVMKVQLAITDVHAFYVGDVYPEHTF
jgi:hypothetical protein